MLERSGCWARTAQCYSAVWISVLLWFLTTVAFIAMRCLSRLKVSESKSLPS